jgi:hypothetical protein
MAVSDPSSRNALLEQCGVLVQEAELRRFYLCCLFDGDVFGGEFARLLEVLADVAPNGGHFSVAVDLRRACCALVKESQARGDALDVLTTEAVSAEQVVGALLVREPTHLHRPVHHRA